MGEPNADSSNGPALNDSALLSPCFPMENVALGRGAFSLDITDMDRRLNLNVADQSILQNALNKIGVETALIPVISDSTLDWRDPDATPRSNGADGDYYLIHPNPGYPPYQVKNGPIDGLAEWLFIRGVTPAMVWGGNGNKGNQSRRPSARNFGLVDLLTPISGRLINVNTASGAALQVLPFIDEYLAQAIVQARAGPDGVEGNEDDQPFRSIQELGIRVPELDPDTAQPLATMLTVRSSVFEVTARAQIDNDQRIYVGLLHRVSPHEINLLYFYERYPDENRFLHSSP